MARCLGLSQFLGSRSTTEPKFRGYILYLRYLELPSQNYRSEIKCVVGLVLRLDARLVYHGTPKSPSEGSLCHVNFSLWDNRAG